MFRSFEPGRDGFVTLIANYQPLQAPYGGPNYFAMDPDALYEIHIDNTGDAVEDLTFQFRFDNALNTDNPGVPGVAIVPGGKGIGLQIGPAGAQKLNSIPFISANVGEPAPAISQQNQNAFRNVRETYGMKVVRGARRTGTATDVTHAAGPGAPGQHKGRLAGDEQAGNAAAAPGIHHHTAQGVERARHHLDSRRPRGQPDREHCADAAAS